MPSAKCATCLYGSLLYTPSCSEFSFACVYHMRMHHLVRAPELMTKLM